MNVALLYLRIVKKFDQAHPEHKSYEESSKRFLRTYIQFKPKIPHRLIVVNCGHERHDGMFDSVATDYMTYSGGGYDCGTYQAIGARLDSDFVVGLNTHTYFWKSDWLEPFVNAVETHGPGVYGATASYENHPHLRTPCIAFTPAIIREYPSLVDSREKAAWFESGPNNFSIWATLRGFPSLLVSGSGVYQRDAWRTPNDIFRRGNQSNCLVKDRHTDIWDAAQKIEKEHLSKFADTWVKK